MRGRRFPWKDDYQFVGPNITADGLRINFPFDPTFPADVGFYKGTGRHLVRPNRQEFLEVIYVYSGSLDLQIRDRRFRLKKGDVVVIGPNIYKQLLYKPTVVAELIGLNFHAEAIRSGASEWEDELCLSSFLCQGPEFPHVISGRRALSREVFQLLLKIHEQQPPHTALDRLTAETYLKALLLLLAKHFKAYLETQETLSRREKDVDRLRPLFQLLHECYGQQIEVRDAARVCAMSSSYFMRFFKRTTGQSFRAYLTALRIARAQSLLVTGKASIIEISQQTGFCSQSYFGEVFRVLAGMSPRAFRRRFGAKIPRPLGGRPSPTVAK